jgi:hypothetical protein
MDQRLIRTYRRDDQRRNGLFGGHIGRGPYDDWRQNTCPVDTGVVCQMTLTISQTAGRIGHDLVTLDNYEVLITAVKSMK